MNGAKNLQIKKNTHNDHEKKKKKKKKKTNKNHTKTTTARRDSLGGEGLERVAERVLERLFLRAENELVAHERRVRGGRRRLVLLAAGHVRLAAAERVFEHVDARKRTPHDRQRRAPRLGTFSGKDTLEEWKRKAALTSSSSSSSSREDTSKSLIRTGEDQKPPKIHTPRKTVSFPTRRGPSPSRAASIA